MSPPYREEDGRGESGRAIIVTGAGRGIGRAICLAFLEAGEGVLAVDRDFPPEEDGIEGTKDADRLTRLTVDLTEEDGPGRVIEAADLAFGRVDGLVNCAGIFPTGSALDIGRDDWDGLMNINLRAPFFLAQAVARRIIDEGTSGFVINIASTAGGVTRPNIAHYSASKAALMMLTKTLALEWAEYGIRVNAVAPGLVETPGVEDLLVDEGGREEHRRKIANIPAERPGRADDVARCVAFLASESADYVTGHTLVVDGGYSAGRVLRPTQGDS